MGKKRLLAVLAAAVCTCAVGAQAANPPDASAILEQARNAQEAVLFETGFEEAEPPAIQQWYGGQVPGKVSFLGVTDEESHSGGHSAKMAIHFEAGRWPSAYFRIPVAIPRWSDIRARFHVKMKAPEKTWSFNGMSVGLAGGTDGNVMQGRKAGEDNGWEVWEVTATKTSAIEEYVTGVAIMFQLPDNSPPSDVTIYLDDVKVTGKLPPDFQKTWAQVYRYFTVDQERETRTRGARRLAGMKRRIAELKARHREGKLPAGASGLLAERYASIQAKIKGDLASAEPMMEAVEKSLADSQTPFRGNLNAPERILSHLGLYVEACREYPGYAAQHGKQDIITFALEPTQSYAILPGGPQGHNEEQSYYIWGAKGGFENPQLLPQEEVIAAAPARGLAAFGCRGTFVPMSFAILCERDLADVMVTASDLRSESGVIPAEAIDIRIVAPWYRPMLGKARLMNEMLLHDPAFVTPSPEKQENAFKDALLGSDSAVLLPASILAGTLRQYFVTVKVPADASAGTYRGRLAIRAAQREAVELAAEVEVLPFDLEPTPYAYSFYYRIYLGDEEAARTAADKFQVIKTAAQMEADLVDMAEHGCNTLNLYVGQPEKKEGGWDFSRLDACLAMAKRAGLVRSPFVWLAHGQYFEPHPREGAPKTTEEVVARLSEFAPVVNAFCDEKGYPRPALYGHDEASGEALMKLREGYSAVNRAGGLVAVACGATYFDEIGDALSLPIVYSGAMSAQGERSIRASQKLGYEAWIYGCPQVDCPAAPSVFRRRYGLAMWRNGEQGAAPWEYQGTPRPNAGGPRHGYDNVFSDPLYCMALPTWEGKPIDTIAYEAFREGVYDARYLATLQKHLAKAKEAGRAGDVVAEIEKWLATFSVNDDLTRVRRKLADAIVALSEATP
ncbi:MAG: hypothetical protein V2A58_18105 [Planctomycetota bacterium]